MVTCIVLMIYKNLTNMGKCTLMVCYWFLAHCLPLLVNFKMAGTFGCLEFSPDDQSLVYLAEQKEPKKESYLQFGLTAPSEGTQVVLLIMESREQLMFN